MELRHYEPYDPALLAWLERLSRDDELDWPDASLEPESPELNDAEDLVLSTCGLIR
jgi:hypothetical protein